jgi:hypothetical protein
MDSDLVASDRCRGLCQTIWREKNSAETERSVVTFSGVFVLLVKTLSDVESRWRFLSTATIEEQTDVKSSPFLRITRLACRR